MSFNELRDALEEAWDQGNACGLDGYVGPGRGTEPIDDEAIYARDRDVDRIMHRCHKAADLTDAHGVTTEYVSHRPVPINPVTGLP